MKRVHENLEPKDFADSEFVTHRYYCMSTGLLATDLCEHKAEGWYKTNTPLPGACTQHKGEVLPPIVPQPEVPADGETPATGDGTSSGSSSSSTGSSETSNSSGSNTSDTNNDSSSQNSSSTTTQ